MRRRLGLLAGLFIIAIGVLGLVSPGVFLRAVASMQVPPAIYVAAAVRIAVGIAIVASAAISRAPWALRIVGSVIAIGGVVTPFVGENMARSVFSWWEASGTGLVRLWGGVGAVLGLLIVVAISPGSRQVRPHANGP